MPPVYVTGHKNPDTDSVVSAIAYAALKNAMGEREAIAVRLGEVNDETQVVLDKFGFEPPILIQSVKTQLRDVKFDTPPVVGSGVTVRTAWKIMLESNVETICISDDDGHLVGTLATSDIAEHDMNSALSGFTVATNAFNLSSALEGCLIGSGEDWDVIEGPIVIAIHSDERITSDIVGGSVLISGDRPDVISLAQKANISCLVLCELDVDSEVAQEAAKAGMHVILTHYDAYRASRLISHSIPVSQIMKKDGIPSFHIDDYLDNVRDLMSKHRAPSYPVLDAQDRVIGTVSRYHLLNHSRKRVILVDHNEKDQSVPGLEQAELIEIVDHHRLGDIQTGSPVTIRMEPVGSATTLVASLFFEHGVIPSKQLAGLIAGAILSDTVMFKSPTCTEKDRKMANRMAQLAGIDLNELGVEIFSAASNIAENEPRTLVLRDFKEFSFGGLRAGIGQVACMDVRDLEKMQVELLNEMENIRKKNVLDFVLFMETEIVQEGTKLLFVGNAQKIIEDAFGIAPVASSIFLPGVMSRKKQVVPAISAVIA